MRLITFFSLTADADVQHPVTVNPTHITAVRPNPSNKTLTDIFMVDDALDPTVVCADYHDVVAALRDDECKGLGTNHPDVEIYMPDDDGGDE